MRFSCIACLDDLLREQWWPAKNFFYDLVREPIRQATGGVDIRSSPRNNHSHNLLWSFDEQTFLRLVKQGQERSWNYFYHEIPEAAQAYLLKHIPSNCLILSYEMPPWLEKALASNQFPFLDIRMSPLRFASDLYVALCTNDDRIDSELARRGVHEDEIRLEASLVAASVRHMRRYTAQNHSLDGALIYVGQTADDASIVDQHGGFLRVDGFSREIISAAREKKCLYKPHPNGGEFAEEERRLLSQLLGAEVDLCHEDIYELLGADDELALIGISSGSLQEAYWFNKAATMLYRPVCPILATEGTKLYSQVRFADFISPLFWHSLCAPSTPAPKFAGPSFVAPNTLRQLHNVWWGYSTYLTKGRQFWLEAYGRSGGWRLAENLQGVEAESRRMQAEVTRIEAELTRIDADRQRIESAYRSLLESRSWRITAPLRFLSRMVRKLRIK